LYIRYVKLNSVPTHLKKLNVAVLNIERKMKEIKQLKDYNSNFVAKLLESLNTTKKKILIIIDESSKNEEKLKHNSLSINVNNMDSDQNEDSNSESFIQQMQTTEVDDFRASLLVVTEINHNHKIMENRDKDLREVHK
jgi:hypothetical protein